MWSITAIIWQSRMLCVHVWMKFQSFGWINFSWRKNKSEAITAIIVQPRMLCVHVWIKFQSFGWFFFSWRKTSLKHSQQVYGSQGCYVSMYGWRFNHLDEFILISQFGWNFFFSEENNCGAPWQQIAAKDVMCLVYGWKIEWFGWSLFVTKGLKWGSS